MKKKLDDITKNELEQLYLNNDWDVKKIANILGCSIRKLQIKFNSFYNTQEKIQELVNKFKIINTSILIKLSLAIYLKQKLLSIHFYQIPLIELVNSYKNFGSFKEISNMYKTEEINISKQFIDSLNSIEDFLYVMKELDIKNLEGFRGIVTPNSIKKKLINLNILDKVLPEYSDRINWVDYFKRFNNNIIEGFLNLKKVYNLNTVTEFHKSKFSRALNYYYPLSNKEKELIFPGCTRGKGWEIEMEENLQKEISDCSIISQKKFENCKNINQLPFDFALYSPSGKLVVLIEVHGPSHFTEVYGTFEGVRKRDVIKHNYCKTNNIPLFYFTYEPSLIETYGYPYYVYTDFNELVKEIKKLLNNPN